MIATLATLDGTPRPEDSWSQHSACSPATAKHAWFAADDAHHLMARTGLVRVQREGCSSRNAVKKNSQPWLAAARGPLLAAEGVTAWEGDRDLCGGQPGARVPERPSIYRRLPSPQATTFWPLLKIHKQLMTLP
jgi:hypothetical protein